MIHVCVFVCVCVIWKNVFHLLIVFRQCCKYSQRTKKKWKKHEMKQKSSIIVTVRNVYFHVAHVNLTLCWFLLANCMQMCSFLPFVRWVVPSLIQHHFPSDVLWQKCKQGGPEVVETGTALTCWICTSPAAVTVDTLGHWNPFWLIVFFHLSGHASLLIW